MARLFVCTLFILASGSALAAPTVLITGSNRGIGYEFARQYAESGATVIATCRSPAGADKLQALAKDKPNLRIVQLDVTDEDHLRALKQKLGSTPIDILINNAALADFSPSQEFGQVDYELVGRMIEVNALGPLRVAEGLVENVAASEQKKLINITSSAGSIGAISRPGFLGYRASKATLNSIMHNLALQLSKRGIIVGLINPGMVDTRGVLDMTEETAPPQYLPMVKLLASGQMTTQRTTDAVANLIGIIGGMSLEDSGRFMNHDGETITW